MPLHMTGLVSRRQLDHPGEKPPVVESPLDFEHVLKYNPNHGPDGRFSSGGGGKPGGTAGTPTTGAFGQKLKKPKGKPSAGGRFDSRSSTQRTMDSGFLRDSTFTGDQGMLRANTFTGDQGMLRGSKPGHPRHFMGTAEQERQKDLEEFGWRESDKRSKFLEAHGHGAYYKKYLQHR